MKISGHLYSLLLTLFWDNYIQTKVLYIECPKYLALLSSVSICPPNPCHLIVAGKYNRSNWGKPGGIWNALLNIGIHNYYYYQVTKKYIKDIKLSQIIWLCISNSEKNIRYEYWYKIDIIFRKVLDYCQYAKIHLYIFTSKSDKCHLKKMIVFTIGSRNRISSNDSNKSKQGFYSGKQQHNAKSNREDLNKWSWIKRLL